MSGSKEYINFINLFEDKEGNERRQEAISEILENSTYLPKPVVYEDIDKSFKEWVEKELYIAYEGKVLPTMSLFVNQRFSEYTQSWSYTDDDKNILLNFKTITRENNPSWGGNQGTLWNVPGDRYYTINNVKVVDDNGTEYLRKYKMKQPMSIDLNYRLSIITNSYKLINEFNILINKVFASRQAYLFPQKHPMPMTLENISDESEYNINDRQFFVQTYTIKLMAYIITEDDFLVEELPLKYQLNFQGNLGIKKASAEIIEGDEDAGEYYNKPIIIEINYPSQKNKCKFTLDTNFNITSIKKDNIKKLKLFQSNDENIRMNDKKEIVLLNEDVIKINIEKEVDNKNSKLILKGYTPDVVYNKNKYYTESVLDFNQFSDEYTIDAEN